MKWLAFIPAVALGVLALAWSASTGSAQQGSSLPNRAVVPMVSSEGFATPAPTAVPVRKPPPPSGPGYCGSTPGGPPFPPNSIFGLLTIGGVEAPKETLVWLTFDGQPGPGAYTLAAGGYRVDYAAGGAGREPRCINEVGSRLGILVDGVNVDAGVIVGAWENGGAGLAWRFDIAIP